MENHTIHTEGGAYVEGSVETGRDFTGRDHIQMGNIGPGAQVAIGSNNRQIAVGQIAREGTDAQPELMGLLNDLRAQVAQLDTLDLQKRTIADHYVGEVGQTLTEDAEFLEDRFFVACHWLLTQLPHLSPLLNKIFAHSTVMALAPRAVARLHPGR